MGKRRLYNGQLSEDDVKNLRRTNIILAVFAFISFLLMIIALLLQVRSERDLRRAQAAKIEARYKEVQAVTELNLTSRALTEAEKEAELATEIAEEAGKKVKDEVTKRVSTEKKLIKTEEVLSNARENEAEALNISKEALRQRMLALGKSMAVRSMQMSDDRDLQTLLAYQAYKFNTANGGSPIDNDIYAGLYNAIKETGIKARKEYRGYGSAILSIAYVPGTQEFFTSASDGRIMKWDMGGSGTDYKVIHEGAVTDLLKVSPDASWLACGDVNSVIRMIPLKGNNIAYELKGHKGKLTSLEFSKDGSALYSSSAEGELLKWDLKAKTYIDFSTGDEKIKYIDISFDGEYLAGISDKGAVSVWEIMDNREPLRINPGSTNFTMIRFRPESGVLALGDDMGNIEIWDIRERRKIAEVYTGQGSITDINFNHLLKLIATAGKDGSVKIWNENDLEEVPLMITDNDGLVTSVTFSQDGRAFLTATNKVNNLVERPCLSDALARDICISLTRNFTREEWLRFVARDVPYEETCTEGERRIRVIERRNNP